MSKRYTQEEKEYMATKAIGTIVLHTFPQLGINMV